jgi:hypothetical protein
MRVVFLDDYDLASLPPAILEWFNPPTQVEVIEVEGVPLDRVWAIDATQSLADKGGVLASQANLPPTAAYYPRIANQGLAIAPHATRFGGNLTFLGYYHLPSGSLFKPEDVFTIITYWRIEGDIPTKTGIFLRLHDTPQASPYTEVNLFAVRPETLKARDVVVQSTNLILPQNLRPQDYLLTIGIYDNNPTNQLPVYWGANNMERGNYLQLGQPFQVQQRPIRVWG